MTRWWGVTALALSIGLNAGLVVAVLQARWQQPTVVVAPPAADAAPAVDGWSVVQPLPGVGADHQAAPGGADPARGVGGGASGAAGAAAPDPGVRAAERAASPGDMAPEGAAAAVADAAPPDRQAAASAPPPRLAEAARPPGPSLPGERPLVGDAPLPRQEEMADRLGVPPEDRPRFYAAQRRFFTATREQRMRLESVRRELRGEIVGAAPDRERIDSLLRQSAELQVGLERAFVEHVLEAREILDGEAEQRYLLLLSRLAPGGRPGTRGPGAARPWERPGDPRQHRPGERPPRRGGPGGW